MGGLFSKKSSSRVTQQDRAVLQLKQQRDQLRQYQKRIEGQLEKDRQCAGRLIKDGKKERALLILRKKRFQEQLLTKADGMLENIEKLTQDIEFAQIEIKVFDGLKAGNNALKQLNQVLSIDEIERIMDETREGIDKQKEIDEILHGQLTADDEEAALEELNEILAAETESQEYNLPEVPTEEIHGDGERVDEERKERATEKKKERVALMAS